MACSNLTIFCMEVAFGSYKRKKQVSTFKKMFYKIVVTNKYSLMSAGNMSHH